MSLLRLQFTTDASKVEQAVSLLERFDATSISVSGNSSEALFADDQDEQAYWQRSTVCALVDEEIELDIVIACLRNAVGDAKLRDYKVDVVGEENRLTSFRPRRGPVVIGERLCICPGWSTAPDAGLFTLHLDPGLAFGSGAHATTLLCLNWLVDNDPGGLKVIDYGCGSGILALAGAILGAADVCAVDIDPQALSATKENAEKNKLNVAIHNVADIPGKRFDLLLANILINPLIELMPRFVDLVRPGGRIVLSGLLATQVEECAEVYDSFFDIAEPAFHDEWAMIYGTKRDNPQ